jgi:hypothetical protein
MRIASYIVATACLVTASATFAAPITDWHTLRATTATTLSGTENSDDPDMGTTATSSSGARLIGYFSPQTLTNVGESITLTFSVRFNDAVGMGSANDNFRFALYDRNGETAETTTNFNVTGTANMDDFRGYAYGVDSAASGTNGSLRQRNAGTGTQDPFAAAANTALSAPSGTDVVLVSSVNGDNTGPTYSGALTITLSAPGEVTLSGSFSGNGGLNTYSFVDTTAVATSYSVVGFLNGGPLSADQATFQNIDVTFVPEPATAGLLGLGAMGIAMRRRA